jgi:hypothetical protein
MELAERWSAGARAIAAGEAWDQAEKEGKVAERGEIGRGRSGKVRDLITNPRYYFSKLFGVNEKYVEQAHALVKEDPLAAAAVKAGAATSNANFSHLINSARATAAASHRATSGGDRHRPQPAGL